MSIEAMKRALEALEDFISIKNDSHGAMGYHLPWILREYITALRAAIEQAEKQEPVAWMVYTLDGKSVCVTDNPSDFSDKNRVLPLYTDPPAAQSQDIKSGIETVAAKGGLLPTREWVGLTDEDIKELWDVWKDALCLDLKTWACAIEAKLKEKNT